MPNISILLKVIMGNIKSNINVFSGNVLHIGKNDDEDKYIIFREDGYLNGYEDGYSISFGNESGCFEFLTNPPAIRFRRS
jgi:hypothetical protein